MWFPWLASERARAQTALPEGGEAPFALVARTGNALRLAAICPRGATRGLMSGMSLADARARCPELSTASYDPEADADALDHLVRRMVRFTPLAAIDPPDGLILDITGAAHLFGGEEALTAQAMIEAGFTARHALADHAATARALVRHGRSDARALPVAALELPEEALTGLRRAGLFTLGDLAARPSSGLAARFGEEAVRKLRAILGEADSPIAPYRTVAPIRADARFAEPIARTSDVLDTIETLLADSARQMEARHIGGRRFVVMLERCDGARCRLEVETGLPTRDPAIMMRLFTERIDTLADPLDPGFGFDAIKLTVPRTEPLASQQIALEGPSTSDESIAALIDRLVTRLGPDCVLRLAPCDTHIPEAAQRLVSASGRAPPSWPTAVQRRASTPPRPLLLFDPPQPVTAIASVPDGPPQRFRWRGSLHEVRSMEGPERIAAEWWRRRDGHLPGHGGLTRDYYRIEDAEGHRFWVFRHGLFEEAGDPAWYIHGIFA